MEYSSQIPFPVWCPEHLEGPSGNFEALLPKTGETFNYNNSQGLMYEAMEVRRCLKEGHMAGSLVALLPFVHSAADWLFVRALLIQPLAAPVSC
ncbi:Trans-1,2-dihydrobenzene-1,2-diol dehydrogenase [Portunus trituberculatus]|uniref:Trans-1,2-dihydrobenzene-1,2-diol dehydrogenase n=1 Tax=Portunus trituberculatus TaxID=210409 RepID=A0A5B7GWS8_PORTR|nr:Trans-1,2-dihydrobenzene-1,2-diol dehydrogenase [Portunus trituberculatus]